MMHAEFERSIADRNAYEWSGLAPPAHPSHVSMPMVWISSTSESSRLVSFVALDRQTVVKGPGGLTRLTAESGDHEQLDARRFLALDVFSMSTVVVS